MGLLERSELLKKEELEIVKVDLGEGNFVFVRQMTGQERDRFEQSLVREVKDTRGRIDYERAMENFRAKLAVNVVCDEGGKNIFYPEDVVTLSQNISAARLELIINVAQRLNAISEEDKEELVKNSGAAPSGDSTLDSANDLDTPTPDSSSES